MRVPKTRRKRMKKELKEEEGKIKQSHILCHYGFGKSKNPKRAYNPG